MPHIVLAILTIAPISPCKSTQIPMAKTKTRPRVEGADPEAACANLASYDLLEGDASPYYIPNLSQSHCCPEQCQ